MNESDPGFARGTAAYGAGRSRRAFRLLCLAALISLGTVRAAPAEHQTGHAGPAEAVTVVDAVLGPDDVSVRLRIADGHYLFAEKVGVESADAAIELGEPRLGPAESHRDPYFGEVEVYRGALDLSVSYRAGNATPSRIELVVHGRGCTLSGDCRPVEVPVVAVREASRADTGEGAPEPPKNLRTTGGDADSPVPGGLAAAAPALARLLELGGGIGIGIGTSGEDEFLDPDAAFVLSAAAAGPDAIEARWEIAEGYYLYRDKFRFRVADASGASLGDAGFPAGKMKDDEYFGPMEVYYGSVAALVPVARAAGSNVIDVDVTYQGCADAGLCYPPITKTVALLLPAALADTGAGAGAAGGEIAGLSDPEVRTGTPDRTNVQARATDGDGSGTLRGSAPGATAAASGVPGFPVPGAAAASGAPGFPASGAANALPVELPEQDRIAAALVSGNRWLVVLSLFGAGLLLTFTPCVLPMVPILTSIIVGQGAKPGGRGVTPRRAFMLSLVYVLAMALTYTVAGVLAGLFGANLAAAFQDPWIVSAFVLVFVLLALSMFGFYDLRMPASWQAGLAAFSRRQRGGTWAGVAAMGALSALIVSPCVAAPLAGVLIYIGQTGDPVLGGVALFALGMGMGVPLIVAGVSAGKLLPRAGAWMNTVKAVFGVMLLAVAIYLLERVVPESVALLLWAALFIVCAIYMGALDSLAAGSGGWRRLWKGTGLVMLVYGVLIMVGVAGGGGDLFRPLRGVALVAGGSSEHEIAFTQVKGVDGLNGELGPAAARGQVVMFDYYADWCVSCKEMERFTFSDPEVQAALSNVLLLQTDVTANDAADQALLAEFGLFGPPAILFFGPDGRERRNLRVIGYMNAGDFRRVVERAISPAASVSASRQALELAS